MTTLANVLVVAEHDNTTIKPATLNTVTAALACGGDVHVLVAGQNAAEAAKAAAQIAGVAKVLHADAAGLAHGLAENVAALVLGVAKNYSHILFPATASGKNVAPRVAAKLDVAQISDITKVIPTAPRPAEQAAPRGGQESSGAAQHSPGPDTFERPIYAGNAIATVQSGDAVKVITVRSTGFDAAAATGGSAAVESLAAAADSAQVSFVGAEIAKNDRPELTAAKIIVSGGRALGSAEKFTEVMTPLADKLGAAAGHGPCGGGGDDVHRPHDRRRPGAALGPGLRGAGARRADGACPRAGRPGRRQCERHAAPDEEADAPGRRPVARCRAAHLRGGPGPRPIHTRPCRGGRCRAGPAASGFRRHVAVPQPPLPCFPE